MLFQHVMDVDYRFLARGSLAFGHTDSKVIQVLITHTEPLVVFI